MNKLEEGFFLGLGLWGATIVVVLLVRALTAFLGV